MWLCKLLETGWAADLGFSHQILRVFSPFFFPGDPLQWLLEDPPVHAGHVPVRLLLPNRWAGGRGPIFASQCNHWDQTPQQHVHVQGQSGFKADIPRFQVRNSFISPAAGVDASGRAFPTGQNIRGEKKDPAVSEIDLELRAFQSLPGSCIDQTLSGMPRNKSLSNLTWSYLQF